MIKLRQRENHTSTNADMKHNMGEEYKGKDYMKLKD